VPQPEQHARENDNNGTGVIDIKKEAISLNSVETQGDNRILPRSSNPMMSLHC
jgi:hypothetical protein